MLAGQEGAGEVKPAGTPVFGYFLFPQSFLHPFLPAPTLLRLPQHLTLSPRRAEPQYGRAWGLCKEETLRGGLEELEMTLSWAGRVDP